MDILNDYTITRWMKRKNWYWKCLIYNSINLVALFLKSAIKNFTQKPLIAIFEERYYKVYTIIGRNNKIIKKREKMECVLIM